ncbi:MAG: hypothetical protein BGO54_06565 [Sphingobacteriales bacterium 46-32]|nr:MAG: hypothetical protein BGO54_06565 [Sphingobacteriales bacterium 46-32]
MKEYKDLLKAVEIFLKQEGLTKKGNTYYLAKDGNLGVINFQRSRDMIEGGGRNLLLTWEFFRVNYRKRYHTVLKGNLL